MKHRTNRSWLNALLFVLGCMLPGFLSSFLGGAWKAQPWYDDSPKPRFWPPQWVFPIAWVGNYTFMGVALSQIWRIRSSKAVEGPLAVFLLHFLHNILFIPIVYHVKQASFYSLMDSIALGSGLVTTILFACTTRKAGLLMLPYLAWLAFTTSIKVAWWRKNAKSSVQGR